MAATCQVFSRGLTHTYQRGEDPGRTAKNGN